MNSLAPTMSIHLLASFWFGRQWSIGQGLVCDWFAVLPVAVLPNPGVTGSVAFISGVVWLHGCWCCLLCSLLISYWSSLLYSLIWMPALMTSLQLMWSAATASQPAELILPAFWSHLEMSLKWWTGLPACLEPVASSPYSTSLGIWLSCMWLTWPSQCKHLWVCKANMLGIPAWARTFLYGTLSCWGMPKILLRWCSWKTLGLCAWWEYRFHASLSPLCKVSHCCHCLADPCLPFGIQGEVTWDGGTKVGEIFQHLMDVVTNGVAWDATEVLAHDVGLLTTDSKTKLSTCSCEAADELL